MAVTFGDVLLTHATRARGRSKATIDRDIVARLSMLTEDVILDYFWYMALRVEVQRLDLLLQLTEVTVTRPPTWDYAAVRREHEQHGASNIRLDHWRCFACQDRENRHYFHHVVEVQNGGSNAVRNQVALCFLCHQYLHPWLTAEPEPLQSSAFESLGAIASRLYNRSGDE